MDIKHKIITLLDNNEKYFVLEKLDESNEEYYLIINIDNENDIRISRKIANNEQNGIIDVTDKDIINNLSIKFETLIEKTREMYA